MADVTYRSWIAPAALLLVWAGSMAGAAELHQRIDTMIAQGVEKTALAGPADDGMFVRRVFLDLAGRIPTATEVDAFLADQSPSKRSQLIDRLLASDDFPQRMKDLFNSMLMERRGENPEWDKFLSESFAANKPWDQLVREILDPDSESEAIRGAAFFHTVRLAKVGQQDTDYPGLTRDVGRLFLGRDLQCAQCHNHLFIDDYKQLDFQGLFTVYQNTFIRTDVTFPAIGENLLTEKQEFMSVFEQIAMTTGPRVPDRPEVEIPQFEKGEEYLLPPDRKTRFKGVPKFSPMEAVALELATPDNRAFVDNIVNRLWFVMMGRGLVMPLDQHHVANPPSHPELLKLLGDEFIAHQCDVKWLLRELALSQTYQRSSVAPDPAAAPAPETFAVSIEKRISPEQLMASVAIAAGPRERQEKIASDEEQAAAYRKAFINAFANTPAEPEVEFAPSLKSALFVLNDTIVLDRLAPQPGNLVDRLNKIQEPAALAEELYVSILSRQPTEEETAGVAAFLAEQKDRQEAVINMAWALIACTEFCLNH
ncbi:DUF1549 domain-containing protein [Lignipirellula cremea]|uniref:Cytochrome c domain-containing protein n=1 Tax=Lignipirellula cremea TaxID=2528010 RepID=A0A518DWJ7_9BACT|nr:DUF1549 domain-containing protein [Lignipirellula cremea]QDU96207.1 hypothetical protein Pla8534_40260 [Lignipirellula cremea]